jgi:hypothetical protein
MKKEERAERKSRSSKGKQDNRFLYFNEEWNTESPSDDDKGTTISDEDGYEDFVDSFPTKDNKTIIDDSFDY